MPEQVEQRTVETNDNVPALEVMDSSAIEAISRAEIDVAIATARRFKRDVADCIKTCRELATRNPQIAARCNYALPRGGKQLIGPSVHFAKIVKYAWGHVNAGSQVIWGTREYARVLGVCHDMQTNVREANIMDHPVQPPHNDTPKAWRDMMNLAKRAGCAIAERNAIFGVIPMVLFEDVLEEAKLLAVGKGKSFIESRDNAVRQCKELKITQPMIYRALGVNGLESIDTNDLIWLHAALQSIREGTATVPDLFGTEKTIQERARAPKKGDRGIDTPSLTPEEKKEEPKQPQPPKKEEVDDLLFSDSDSGTDLSKDYAKSLESLIKNSAIDKNEWFAWLNAVGVKHAKDDKLKVLTYIDLGPADLENLVENWEFNLLQFGKWRQAHVAS